MSGVLVPRLALIGIATAVALPSPWAPLWGGQTSGGLAPVLGIGALGASLVVLIQRRLGGGHLWVDVMCLTGLLSVSGAAQNPFSVLYFVPITLASIVQQRSTWRVALLSVLGFSLLLFQTTIGLWPHRNHPHHAHFFHHVVGMAIAVAVAGAFISFFVHKVAMSLARQENQLREYVRQQREDRFAVSLGALAAGAAHELGTPLGTVQLLAEDLPQLAEDDLRRCAAEIVEQVARMKRVLHGLASSELSAEVLREAEPWDAGRLLERLGDSLLEMEVVVARDGVSTQPLTIVEQMTRELLENARQAAGAARVSLRVEIGDERLTLTVSDTGPGVDAEELALVLSPFYSGRGGTGLGLFLASVHARQLGGELSLSSALGRGTRVVLALPALRGEAWPRGLDRPRASSEEAER